MDDLNYVLRALENFQVFREFKGELDTEELLFLILSIRFKKFKYLDVICSIGEIPNEVYYVLEGKIAVTNIPSKVINIDDLNNNIFHFEGKGSVLGEASILYSSNR